MLVVLLVDSTHVGGDVIALGGGCDQHLLGTSLVHSIAAGEVTQVRLQRLLRTKPLRAAQDRLEATQDRL